MDGSFLETDGIDYFDNDVNEIYRYKTEEELNHCPNDFSVTYYWKHVSICCALIITGLVLCLSGYRCFRFCMWLSGALFATVSVLAICNRVDDLPHGANWGAALSVGSLVGCITHLIPGLGLFLWGVYGGALFSSIIVGSLVAFGVFLPSPFASACILILLGGSFFGAMILTKHASKPGLIAATALCGAFLITAGLDYFIENWRLYNYLWHELVRLAPEPLPMAVPCWYSYCVLALWPLFTAVGCFTQGLATARKYKQKVERVHVPQAAQQVYGTIRRTIGRHRGRARIPQDAEAPRPAARSSRSRSSQQQQSRRQEQSRPTPSAPSSEIATRASRNRDRAREQRRQRLRQSNESATSNGQEQEFSERSNSDRQRLLHQNNQAESQRPTDSSPPPAYHDIFKNIGRRKN